MPQYSGVWILSLCALSLAPMLMVGAGAPPRPQPSFTATELAEYPLTEPILEKFARATRLLMAATRGESRFAEAPLFSRDISVSGDAPQMAAALQQRLDTDPLLATALFAADLSARDYATFALTLFAARLAHGFIESGALRGVPAGVAESNVRFVGDHKNRISALLRDLGVEH